MPNDKTDSIKIKLPNGNVGKIIKGGAATTIIGVIIYMITTFVSPNIQANKNDIEKLDTKLDHHVEEQFKSELEVRSVIPAVEELKTKTNKIQEDVSEIKGDIKVIMSKLDK